MIYRALLLAYPELGDTRFLLPLRGTVFTSRWFGERDFAFRFIFIYW